VSLEDLQKRLDAVLSPRGRAGDPELASAPEATGPIFTQYSRKGAMQATDLASRFMAAADRRGGEEGLADAVDEIERALAAEETPGLVQQAVKLFITHHPEARAKLRLERLERRQPGAVGPSKSNSKPGRDEDDG
jgi:hypothetical protein